MCLQSFCVGPCRCMFNACMISGSKHGDQYWQSQSVGIGNWLPMHLTMCWPWNSLYVRQAGSSISYAIENRESSSWRCHDMEAFSKLLALCVGTPPATGGFPSQRARGMELWCFLWCMPEWILEQTAELMVIGTPWCWCDASFAITQRTRDLSRYAPSQWETSLHCNDVSHWLDVYLDSSLELCWLFLHDNLRCHQ